MFRSMDTGSPKYLVLVTNVPQSGPTVRPPQNHSLGPRKSWTNCSCISLGPTVIMASPTLWHFFFFVCFWGTSGSFSYFFPLLPLTEVSPQPSAIPRWQPTQEIGSQLWAGETPDSNPGLQDNSLVRYHWATTPPSWATTPPCDI